MDESRDALMLMKIKNLKIAEVLIITVLSFYPLNQVFASYEAVKMPVFYYGASSLLNLGKNFRPVAGS